MTMRRIALSIDAVRSLLLAHPCLAAFFAELPWDKDDTPGALLGWDPDSRVSKQAVALLHDRQGLKLGNVIDWRIESRPVKSYDSGGYGAKESSRGPTGSTTFALINGGGLVLVDGHRVRRVIGRRSHSTHLVSLRLTKGSSGVRVEFLLIDLPSRGRGRRGDTGKHSRVRGAA